MNGYFITGTDTGIGKTMASVALLHALTRQGLTAVGMKPVASGCATTAEGLRNEDALALQAASSVALPYEQINPYAFALAIAPHIAAELAAISIDLEVIAGHYRQLATQAEVVVVEGVGGWRVPLNPQQDVADLAAVLDLPVILVVGLRLGCINHALLTADSIRARGLKLVGWIANYLDPEMTAQAQNIQALQQRLAAPLLAELPWDDEGRPLFADERDVLEQLNDSLRH